MRAPKNGPVAPEEEPFSQDEEETEEEAEDDELLDFGRTHDSEDEQFGDPTKRKTTK